ncbi:MAG: hypothetical protein HQL39_20435 [Alphaproteobacteria bacterium]|nr:hypothetical protein [Alphaproteobacteria bacterium]
MTEEAQALKKRTIDAIIDIEGGYSDHPADSGGATMYGITEAVARAAGHTGPMRDLPRPLAFQIYVARYWNPLRLDDIAALSVPIAAELADTGINMGPPTAARFLQRALNALNQGGRAFADVAVDGVAGGGTVTALQTFLRARGEKGERVLLRALNCLQGARYIALAENREKDEAFVFGWLEHRVVV